MTPLPPPRAPITALLDDPQLLGPFFQGPTWDRWKVFLKSAFGLRMNGEELAVYQTFTGRYDPPSAAAREIYAVVGRRGGKSRIAAVLGVFMATCRDYRPGLALGETATVAIIASDRKQAGVIFGYIAAMLDAVPRFRSRILGRTGSTIDLKGNVRIEVSTASFRAVRGYTFACVICDEISFWQAREDSANPDIEIVNACRPGLLTLGGPLIGISSPYARRGVLWTAYRKHYGQESDQILCWQASTTDMHPDVDRTDIDAAYAEDPARAAAEFGAIFRSDLETFVAPEVVDACTPDREELPPLGDVQHVAFVDPSGGKKDSFTLGIAHLEWRDGKPVAVLDVLRETRPPFDPDAVAADYAAVCQLYRVTSARGDRYAGEWSVQTFARYGLHVAQDAAPKSELYLGLLAAMNARRVELLAVPRLRAQLIGLDRRSVRGGRDSIDHAPGAHDDVANAAAGAVVEALANTGGGELLVVGERRHPIDIPRWSEVSG